MPTPVRFLVRTHPSKSTTVLTRDKPGRPFVILTAGSRCAVGAALGSVLEGSGYEVIAACSGHEALALARAAAPDAVLIDFHLPDMAGVEVCRRLSGDATFAANCPIFLLSAHGASRQERHSSYAAGAWDLWPDPLDGEALLLKLQVYLRARQAAERSRTRPPADEADR